MSLRLLLADESSSIKKAFELALKDYQVKIQTVHQGIDVKEIFDSFQPDICFIDIMLPKLNGYDACKALKEDSSSQSTPVVLMWSGFMELDSNKFSSCKADGSIEKPFETKTLRDTVQRLLSQLGDNEISSHLIMDEVKKEAHVEDLEFPDLPNDLEALDGEDVDLPPLDPSLFGDVSQGESTDPGSLSDFNNPTAETSDSSVLDLPDLFAEDDEISHPSEMEGWEEQSATHQAPESLDDIDSFSVESLNVTNDDESLPFESPEGLELPPTPAAERHAPVQERHPIETLTQEIELDATEPEELRGDNELIIEKEAQNVPQLSKEELKRLILAQSKDIIESVVWDVVPELAKEMIQKEIQRLTGEIKHESDLR